MQGYSDRWSPAASQHAAPPKVKLPPFWTKDTRSWFTLAESTFNRSHVTDTRLRFDLVLPALPEEVIEQLRSILHTVDDIADPYRALKTKLLSRFTPKPLDLCQRIINGGESGDRSPGQLMDFMLALLPPGEPESMLFKTHFLNRLPADIRNHVAAAGFNNTASEMADIADTLWFASSSRQSGNKRSQAVAAVQKDDKHPVGTVAALSVPPKRPQPAAPAATTAAATPMDNPSNLLYLVDTASSFFNCIGNFYSRSVSC